MRKLKKVISIISVFILTFMLTCCGKSDTDDKYNSFKNLSHEDKVSKMEEEVKYMCEKLEKKHINLYHNISREEFKDKEDKLIKELPDIENETDYYFALTELISSIGEGHTVVKSNDAFVSDLQVYDFNVQKFNDDWVITGIGEKNRDKLGYKVKKINNVSIDEVFNKILAVYPHENDYFLINKFSAYAQCAQLLKRIKVIDEVDEDILLTLEDENSKTVDIKVPLVKYDEKPELAQLKDEVKPMETAYQQDKIYWSDKLKDNIYYIQYNQCAEDESLPIDEFKEQVADDIKSGKVKKVIIDLRYNGGGNSNIIQPLYDELNDLSELNLKFYILIGNKTFSSAILNAYDGKQKLGAVLVGKPTGGCLNGYGEVKVFELPYSGFSIGYSTKYFELQKGYDKDALYPDIDSEINITDYINGIDTVVEKVIND